MARTPRDRRGIAGVPPARAADAGRAAEYAVETSVIRPRTAPPPRAAVYASDGRPRGSRPVETRPGSAFAMTPPPPATTHVGPLGSTVHVIRADAGTVADLAAVDWSRRFRRVCLDPVRGLIALTAPSHLHEDLTRIFDDIVETAADGLGHISKGLRSVRLRGRREPPGTGMEPDCTFYVGARAERYWAAAKEGEASAEAFLVEVAPDLVVETEITSADEGKAERYGQMGVRELWRLYGRKGSPALGAEFVALRRTAPPRRLAVSEVLEGLTPDDVCEAVEGVRFGRTRAERTEAVARIVRRRQRGSVRVREPDPPPWTAAARGPRPDPEPGRVGPG